MIKPKPIKAAQMIDIPLQEIVSFDCCDGRDGRTQAQSEIWKELQKASVIKKGQMRALERASRKDRIIEIIKMEY